MPATPNIVVDLLDLLTNRLALDDLMVAPQDLLDRLAIQLEYWDSMAISLSSDIEREK